MIMDGRSADSPFALAFITRAVFLSEEESEKEISLVFRVIRQFTLVLVT